MQAAQIARAASCLSTDVNAECDEVCMQHPFHKRMEQVAAPPMQHLYNYHALFYFLPALTVSFCASRCL